ncbi:hypothetical protein GUJ93_ZPchr0005g14675 [Zizania palustris]|uniref:Uncharacterized protein n=1 Tax=Zizania palustris TaxID=103762 RepID=A0A8J5S445_ZIZPA|nr:hypothetical protein GUJ93_ZPchr0005g14675 [Zizania palustris]
MWRACPRRIETGQTPVHVSPCHGGGFLARGDTRPEIAACLGLHDQPQCLTFLSTSSAVTRPCCHPSISTATPISSTMRTLFVFCSEYSGQHSIGTPAVRDRPQRRVPPVVRDKRVGRPVPEHIGLRRPRLDDEATAAGPLRETLWKQRLEVRIGAALEELGRVGAARGLDHPHKPVARVLQADGHLRELLSCSRRCVPSASEAKEHDSAVLLLVEPCEAMVPLGSHASVAVLDQRPDAVHRRQVASRQEAWWVVSKSSGRRALQRLKRVQHDAVELCDFLPQVDERLEYLALRIFEHKLSYMRSRRR